MRHPGPGNWKAGSSTCPSEEPQGVGAWTVLAPYNGPMALPPALEEEVRRFQEAFGPEWEERLLALLREERKHRQAAKGAARIARCIAEKSGLTGEEVFQRLGEG